MSKNSSNNDEKTQKNTPAISLRFRVISFFIGLLFLQASVYMLANSDQYDAIGLYIFVPLGMVISIFVICLAFVKVNK
jgi:prepilin signal peptidase PulO-like enzyme (type II secretory pathway)